MNTDKIYAEAIANEYSKKETSKVVQLKKLDSKVKTPAAIFGFTFGILSSLILGTGMCLSMGVIGAGTTASFVAGTIIGIIGIAGVAVNYRIYKTILNRAKERYAGDIIALARQISDGE